MNDELVKQYADLLIKKVQVGDSIRWKWAAKRTAEIEAELDALETQLTDEERLAAAERYRRWFAKYLRFM